MRPEAFLHAVSNGLKRLPCSSATTPKPGSTNLNKAWQKLVEISRWGVHKSITENHPPPHGNSRSASSGVSPKACAQTGDALSRLAVRRIPLFPRVCLSALVNYPVHRSPSGPFHAVASRTGAYCRRIGKIASFRMIWSVGGLALDFDRFPPSARYRFPVVFIPYALEKYHEPLRENCRRGTGKPYADDATVPEAQASAPGDPALLPDGRFLRAVL